MKINIITSPRMGSTYFYNMLRNFYSPYQNFSQWNEVFNIHNRKPTHDLSEIIYLAKVQTDVVAKNHITYFKKVPEHLLHEFLNDIPWYNIVLLRRDFFSSSVSLARSMVSNEWTEYSGQSVHIPIDVFENAMLDMFHNVKSMIHNFYKIPYHEIIYYEDLAFNHKEDFPKLKLEKKFDYKQREEWYPEIQVWKLNRKVKSAPDKYNSISNLQELADFASSKYRSLKSKRFVIRNGFIQRINWDTQYIDIENF